MTIEKLPIRTYFDNKDREVTEGTFIEFKINEIVDFLNNQDKKNMIDQVVKESNADQRLTLYKAELITEIEKLRGRKHNVYNMDNKVANDTANYVWEEALDSVLDIIKKKQ